MSDAAIERAVALAAGEPLLAPTKAELISNAERLDGGVPAPEPKEG